MAKSTDAFGNEIDMGLIEMGLGAVFLLGYGLVWAMFMMPYLILISMYWIGRVIAWIIYELVRFCEAVHNNVKDSWRD